MLIPIESWPSEPFLLKEAEERSVSASMSLIAYSSSVIRVQFFGCWPLTNEDEGLLDSTGPNEKLSLG